MSNDDREILDRMFEESAPDPLKLRELRESAEILATDILAYCPPGFEHRKALEHLQLAYFYAKCALIA